MNTKNRNKKLDIGCKTYKELDEMFDHFITTGRYYNSNKKFRSRYEKSFHAFSINLWNGRVWGVTKEGKRKLLKQVIN